MLVVLIPVKRKNRMGINSLRSKQVNHLDGTIARSAQRATALPLNVLGDNYRRVEIKEKRALTTPENPPAVRSKDSNKGSRRSVNYT